MPFSCSVIGGRVRLEPALEQQFVIVGARLQQPFTFCVDNDPQRCRTWMTHRFSMPCAGKEVAWVDVAAAATAHTRAMGAPYASVEQGRLSLELGVRSRPGMVDPCRTGPNFVGRQLRGQFASGRDYDCFAHRPDKARRVVAVFPAGFAPMGLASARVVLPSPAAPLPPVATASTAPSGANQILTAKSTPDGVATSPAPAIQSPALATARPQSSTAPPPGQVFGPPTAAEIAAISRIELGPFPIQTLDLDPARRTPVAFVPAHRTASDASVGDKERAKPMPPVSVATSWTTVVSQADSGKQPASGWSRLAIAVLVVLGPMALLAVMARALVPQVWRAMTKQRARPATGQHFAEPGQRGAAAKLDEQQLFEIVRSDTTGHIADIRDALSALSAAPPLRSAITDALHVLERRQQAILQAPADDDDARRRTRARLERVLHDLRRLREIGDSAVVSFTTGRNAQRALPRDKTDAYEALGVNADVDTRILKKLVDALRQSWHPDFARDDADRQIREERIKEINVAWGLIAEKRAAG